MQNTFDVLYVTSFAKDMFDSTGKRLLDSFISHMPVDNKPHLLVCYENFDFLTEYPNRPNMLTYPLHTSKYLNNWLDNNKDIIPIYLGGTATKESSPRTWEGDFFNRKASRWFRKIASLEYAVNHFNNYDAIIWLDSDCYIIKTLTNDFINSVFDKYNAFYHLGPKRIAKKCGIESGIIGFKKPDGYKLLQSVFNTYKDKSFKNFARWDDGWVFREVFNINANIYPQIDLILNTNPKNCDAIKFGPFKDYIIHDKGLHLRNKIMI
jgi:hypothetical protein